MNYLNHYELGAYAPHLNDALSVTGSVLATILAADLAIAVFHHLMDRYGDPSCPWKWFSDIIKANRLHHSYPSALLQKTPLKNAAETLAIGIAIAGVAWILGALTWQVFLFSFVVGVSALVHRVHHIPTNRLCGFIKALQAIGLLQEKSQHSDHHRYHDVNYSVITNVVNWVLEKTRALRFLEKAIGWLGFKPYDLEAISNEERRRNKS